MRENLTPHQRALRAAAERTPVANSNLTPTFGDVVSYTKPLLAKGAAAQWRVRSVDPDGTLILDLIGGRNGRSTARFGVQTGKVTVVKRAAKAAGPATVKHDVNGKDLVAGDTVVWEADGGIGHHGGYVSERQDTDPIDIRVQPVGAAGDTYVVIAARRLRLAKQGNGGKYTVSDLVDMADNLEARQSKAVSTSRYVGAGRFKEDDKTVSEAVAPVTGPKFEVMSAAHHRNGVSGRGFYVGIVKHWGDLPEGEDPRLLQVIAVPEDDAPEDVSKITFENGSGAEIYVTDLMVIAKQGTVAFGINSFRGDHFYAEARAIIIQTRNDWDNQMLRLNR